MSDDDVVVDAAAFGPGASAGLTTIVARNKPVAPTLDQCVVVLSGACENLHAHGIRSRANHEFLATRMSGAGVSSMEGHPGILLHGLAKIRWHWGVPNLPEELAFAEELAIRVGARDLFCGTVLASAAIEGGPIHVIPPSKKASKPTLTSWALDVMADRKFFQFWPSLSTDSFDANSLVTGWSVPGRANSGLLRWDTHSSIASTLARGHWMVEVRAMVPLSVRQSEESILARAQLHHKNRSCLRLSRVDMERILKQGAKLASQCRPIPRPMESHQLCPERGGNPPVP